MHWLAKSGDANNHAFIKRFDPRYWTLNFPRPMMAAVTTLGSNGLRADLVFYERDNLAGLIWESEDRLDPPLLAYETSKDYSGVRLSFRWQSSGIRTLPEVNGPTLTIEGRDQNGAARTWFVRLANYAQGAGDDAVVSLDFDNLDGGFLLPSQADPVFPGDIDRLFISMVPDTFDGVDGSPLPAPLEAWVEITDLDVSGSGSVFKLGDAFIPPHQVRLANGYDDVFNQTPERLLRNSMHLGYSSFLDHYVGMSHYFRLVYDAGEARFIATRDGQGSILNEPCRKWHEAYFKQAVELGFKPIISISYEIFDEWMPEEWKQRTHDGSRALTGYTPPSSLIAPTHMDAVTYVADALVEFGDVAAAAGCPEPFFQIGEPWWWYQLFGGAEPCFYDATTQAAYTAQTGRPVPQKHLTVFETPTAEQSLYLDWLAEKLAESTFAIRDRAKASYPNSDVAVLFFTPQVLRDDAPMLGQVNLPPQWAAPAFDIFQLEDYDHVIVGDWGAHDRGLDLVRSLLGYSDEDSYYFAGFAIEGTTLQVWQNIDRAIEDGKARGFKEVFTWAYPQIARDGFTYFELKEEDDMAGFHDIRFPLDIAFGSQGGPRFSTTVTELASGAEQRNINWSETRARYDISTGIRADADVDEVLHFFRARQGRAFGFRFKDWADFSSSPTQSQPTPFDQLLASADGLKVEFNLTKSYGEAPDVYVRRIAKPVPGSVRLGVDGVEVTSGFTVDGGTGVVTFDSPPTAGAAITAGFEFDVPVRFESDALNLSVENFKAGAVGSISLLEIRV